MFVILFFVGAYFEDAYKKKELPHFFKASAILALAAVVGVCINISNLYHTYEYSKETMRGKSELKQEGAAASQTSSGLDRDYITNWSYGIGETLTLLVPNVKGGGSGSTMSQSEVAMAKANPMYSGIYSQLPQYFGEQPWTAGPVYVGAFVMFLFVLGVMELQPGQVNWGVYNPQPIPGAVRMWVYHVFAGGGKFVCNYRFRQPLKGSEQYHYGMIMTDGVTLSPGGEEYVRITQEMKKLRAAYDKKSRMPKQLASRRIGLLFDMNNYWEMEFQRQTDQWWTMPHIDKYYNLLKSFAAPVDVISEKEDFSGYPFLIAPAYQLLDNNLVERWTEYVKNGGHLILTYRTGQKDRDAKLWEAPLAAPIHQLAGINSLYYDHLPHSLYGKVDFGSEEYAWNNWADVLTPAAGTDVWAVYTDQFYKGAASVIHRRLGKGTVTYIGTDTDDGKLEKEVVRRVYTEAGVPTEDLLYGVVKEWRDGFYIALNYTSDIQEIVIPDEAEVLIGSARLEPAGVVVWKEKSDNKYK